MNINVENATCNSLKMKEKVLYPLYQSEEGHITKFYRDQFLKTANLSKEDWVLSCAASNNKTHPMYFWQLYSVLGPDKIKNIITRFYENVFQDTEEWFSKEFIEGGAIEYHIRRQTLFWYDVMGGGPHYKGGKMMLHKHHRLVKSIMTTEGALRWMMHMQEALEYYNQYFSDDPRILQALYQFLRFMMGDYAKEFYFEFGGSKL